MYKSLDLIEDGIGFFSDIKKHLNEYFQIKTTNPFLEKRSNLRKDGIKTKAVKLKIKNRESLENFRRYIGFDDKNKADRLDKILE